MIVEKDWWRGWFRRTRGPFEIVMRDKSLANLFRAHEEAREAGAEIVRTGHVGGEFWFLSLFNSESEALEFYERMRRA